MKKKMIVVLTVCAMAMMMTACGSKKPAAEPTTAAVTTAEATTTAEEVKETTPEEKKEAERESKKAELATVDEKEAAGPGATEEQVASIENQNFEDLEKSDYAGFAKKIVEAVKAKDLNALADLMAYPTYVSCAKENDGVVESKEQFLALGAEAIFDESLVKAITEADLSKLEPLMAGVVLGEDTPNIIFNSVDGKLGIVGINY